MPTSYRAQLLSVIAGQERDLERLFDAVLDRIRQSLYSHDDRDGHIPTQEQELVRRQIADAVVWMFLASNLRAFAVDGGVVRPLSPFARLVWENVEGATQIAVAQQAAILRSHLRNDPDLLRLLERAQQFPSLPGFASAYDLVRSSGRTMADSIAFAALETRRKTLLLVNELLAERRTVDQMYAELRRFLTPGQHLQRRNKPYGTTGTDTALAIARSEPMLAYAIAAKASARLNPFVTQVYVERSHSAAPPCPICDEHVRNSPYDVTAFPLPAYHPHCLCRLRFVTRSTRAAVERLRGDLLNVRGALSPDFTELLLRSGMEF